MFTRKQIFVEISGESAFLWGARQTGKSTLLKAVYPQPRKVGKVMIMPWRYFLDKLWTGEVADLAGNYN